MESWIGREVCRDAHRSHHTLTYKDTKPDWRSAAKAWRGGNYPIVEWTLYFKNEGDEDTPLIESIRPLDVTLRTWSGWRVSIAPPHGRQLFDQQLCAACRPCLVPKRPTTFAPVGGRPTNGAWPYFNLERPDESAGVIIAIGWPGQWWLSSRATASARLACAGGQELARFKLHPGEEVRTPLIVLQFYKGDSLRAQNIWRQWMFDHNFPKDHGKPLAPKLGAASVQYYGFNCNQAGDHRFHRPLCRRRIRLDYWWMDAGWYKHGGAGWPKVGTWEVDDQRFPGRHQGNCPITAMPKGSRRSSGSRWNVCTRIPGSPRSIPSGCTAARAAAC